MNELVKALQARIADLERDNARYENARHILALEVDYWRSRALGMRNTHPAAPRFSLRDRCESGLPADPTATG